MITADQIRDLRTKSDDYDETQRLKEKLARLREERAPFYLTLEDFNEILKWKLRGQFGRQRELREANTDDLVRCITTCALGLSHEDEEYETTLRLRILCALRGVDVPVASAVLALTLPENHAVIDFRGWRQVFGEDRRAFSVSDYWRYLKKICPLAAELKWPVQETDLAIWEHDRRHFGHGEG